MLNNTYIFYLYLETTWKEMGLLIVVSSARWVLVLGLFSSVCLTLSLSHREPAPFVKAMAPSAGDFLF